MQFVQDIETLNTRRTCWILLFLMSLLGDVTAKVAVGDVTVANVAAAAVAAAVLMRMMDGVAAIDNSHQRQRGSKGSFL